MTKLASAYLRNGKIFLQSRSKSTSGSWRFSGTVVAAGEDDGKIGEKVLAVLAQSAVNVPDTDLDSSGNAMAMAAGFRSYEKFADMAKCVSITLEDNVVTFTPTRNGGYRKRFLFLDTKIRCQPSPTQVAEGLRAAFDACVFG